jgi:hypothetical protein
VLERLKDKGLVEVEGIIERILLPFLHKFIFESLEFGPV